MANPTYTLIGTPQVVGSGGASSVTFSSIPSTYTDLKIVVSARSNSGNLTDNGQVQVGNGGSISTTGYSDKTLYVNGTTPASYSNSGSFTYVLARVDGGGATTSTFSNSELYFSNYTSSNYKSISCDATAENNGTNSGMGLSAGLWSNTSAITDIRLYNDGGNWVQYSSFYLYGIKNS